MQLPGAAGTQGNIISRPSQMLVARQQMSILMDFIASFLNLLKWTREFIICSRMECQERNLNSKFYNDLGVSPNSIVTLIQTKLFPLRKVNF